MNTMCGSSCHYKAILADGSVHYLGYSSSFNYGDTSYEKSKFGGKYASFEEYLWDDDEPLSVPTDYVRLIYPSEIIKAWNGKSSWGAAVLAHMFSLCNIPEDAVIGMIITREDDGRWDFESSVETFVIPKPRRQN